MASESVILSMPVFCEMDEAGFMLGDMGVGESVGKVRSWGRQNSWQVRKDDPGGELGAARRYDGCRFPRCPLREAVRLDDGEPRSRQRRLR